VQTAEEQKTIIATCCQDEARIREYQKYACRIIVTERADGKVDLKELMRQLGADGIESVLLEGGAMLNWSALEAGIVNEVYAYVAPKLFGGADAKSPVAGMGVDHPDDAYHLVNQRTAGCNDGLLLLCGLHDTALKRYPQCRITNDPDRVFRLWQTAV